MNIDSDAWRQMVIDGAENLGVHVSNAQALMMGRHARELLNWNQTTNLTSITDTLEVAIKHFVDAVAAAPWIDDNLLVLDAGSGGGFPGIPLKILRPDLSITMVDSVRKKVSFLKYAIRMLGLTGIDAVHGRLEEIGRLPDHHEQYGLVICRAFASLEKFVTLSLPFLIPGGQLLAMKGRTSENGQHAIRFDDGETILINNMPFSIDIHRYQLPVVQAQRSLVRIVHRLVPGDHSS